MPEVVKPTPVIVTPAKKKEELELNGAKEKLLNYLLARFPWLRKKMREGGMTESPKKFMEWALVMSGILTAILLFITALIISVQRSSFLFLIPALIVIYPLMFLYAVQLPKAKASKRRREIDKDILFAGRHIWISLKGGLPLFDTIMAVAKGEYGEVSRETAKIVEKVSVGIPLDVAMTEVTEDCPSPTLRRILMQIVNSVRSGADVAESLDVVLDQVSKEQIIDIREYGQKINPVVMFYMVFGVIFPSLGITVGILLLSFAGITITAATLWPLLPLIILVQYVFLTFIEVSRPSYEV